jgi:DNA polymerase III epsilon subunit-like protein
MSICILTTCTNGIHKTNEFVSKKNIQKFARLISVNYLIGDIVNNQFIEKKKVKNIIIPEFINFDKKAQEFHGISNEKALTKGIKNDIVMKQLKNDLQTVKHIVSHSITFHIKALQVECFRTATYIDFSKFNLIDTMSFNHEYFNPKLTQLCKNLNISESNNNLKMVKKVFLKLNQASEKISA